MAKVILDISHHETVKDWDKLKANVSFLIFKATEGTTFLDPKCYETIAKCEKYGVPYWLYTFLKKGNELAQAKYMVSKCQNRVGKYFVGYCLDAERGNLPSNVQKALDYIRTQSKKTMLYTAHHYYYLYKDMVKTLGDNCAWWEPRYSSSGPHAGVELWQYSESYSCSYISGLVDINRIYGKKTLEWFTSPTGTVPIKKETVPKTNPAPVVSYYPKYTGKSQSIVDALKAVGVKDTSLSYRKKIAIKNGISQYTGKSSQNMTILTMLKAGRLKKV